MIKKILVSQPKPTSEKSPYFAIAERFGVELVFRPFIKVEGLTSKEFRQQKVSIGDGYRIHITTRHRPFLQVMQGTAGKHLRGHEVLLCH